MTTPIGYAPVQLIPSLDGFAAMVDKQLGGTLKVAGKRGGREFGAAVADGLKASEADVKKAFDNHARLADRAADATDKLKVAQAGYDELVKKGVTEGKRYEAAIAAKNKASRDETRAIRAATDALQDYERAADSAKTAGTEASTGFLAGLKGSARGAGSAGSDAAASFAEGFAGSSALLRMGSAGGPVGLAVAAAGVALGGVLWTNIKAGIDREPGRDLVQARLGASDSEIANIARTSGAVYANNFGESRDEAMRASQLAIQGGLVANAFDPALQQVSERLLAISQLVGAETSEIAKSASILFRTGMADSAEQAFDIIAKGYQVTGDLGADWLDSIGEYSSGWKNAGLTAQQSLALIKQAQDNGVDVTDRSADALREFGRRITEEGPKMVEILDAIGLNGQQMYDRFKAGGPGAFEAFDTVFDKIRAIEDPADRGQAVLALLGDTAGDFSEAFEQWDPSAAVDALGQIDGAARAASDTMGDNVAGSFESAQRNIDVAMQGVQDSLAEAFGPTLETLANGVVTHKDDIADAFFTMGEVGIRLSQVMLASFGAIVGAISLFGQALGDSYGLVMKLGEGIATITGDDEKAAQFRKDAEAAFGFGEGLTAAADAMVEASKDNGLLESLRRTRDGLNDTGTDADTAADAVDGLGTSVDRLRDSVANLPPSLPPWMKDLGSTPPPGAPPGTAPPGAGITPGQNPLDNLLGPNAPAGSAPPPGAVIPGPPGTGGIGLKSFSTPLPGKKLYTGPATENTGGGIVPRNAALQSALTQTFPGTKIDNDYRQPDGFNEHSSGEAVDIAVNPGGGLGTQTPEGQARGSAMNSWLLKNAAALGLKYTIWQGKEWYPDGTTKANGGQGVTGGHWDHIHARVRGGAITGPDVAPHGALSGAETGRPVAIPATRSSNITPMGADWDAMAVKEASGDWASNTGNGYSGGLQFTPETWSANKPAGAPAEAWQATREQQIAAAESVLKTQGPKAWPKTFTPATGAPGLNAPGPTSPDLTNAFGAGYKPGIGTPGYNEYGEPGYYETDPRRIAQAQRSVEDNKQRIADTETAVTDADTALADALKERDRIAQMTEVQRISAGESLDKANSDVERAETQADRARREAERAKEDAQWVQEDLNEAMQGSFSSAKPADKGGKKGGASASGLSLPSTFSGFGSAIGEFAGGQIGSALDVFGIGDSPPWLQAASKLIGGISVSDSAGNSLFDGGNIFGGSSAPLAASPTAAGAPMDPSVHGARANQAPGPTYNIRTATVEDAFIKARRIENEKALAKTSRF